MDNPGYKYHMRKEIGEQPAIFERLVAKYLDGTKIGEKSLEPHLERLKSVERVTFVGCGSSFHAGLFGNYIFEEITGLPCEYEFANEFVDRKPVVEFGTTFVFLSQSGRTGDTLEAARRARETGAFIISITNHADSELARLSHLHLDSDVGEEKGVAATKSMTATLLLEVILALALAQEQRVGGEQAMEIIKRLKSLPDKAAKVLELEKEISRHAIRIHEKEHLLVLGRKFNYPVALEAAHKIKETSYVDAEAYSSEEFLHGPNAIIEPGWPVFILIPDDSVSKRNLAVAEELIKLKADVVTVSDMRDCCLCETRCWQIPATHEVLTPILNTILMQILAFHLGVARELDIDNPRHIQKFRP